MYDKILVPTDGSNDAMRGARHAVDLARAVDAAVHGLYVIEEGGNPWRSEPMDDQMDEAVAYGMDLVEQVGELARDAGVAFVGDTAVGKNVADEIDEYVVAEGIDLVVLGSGYYGQMGALLGSTADRVVRTASVPILTVKRDDD